MALPLITFISLLSFSEEHEVGLCYHASVIPLPPQTTVEYLNL
jgi:hypothetical protein